MMNEEQNQNTDDIVYDEEHVGDAIKKLKEKLAICEKDRMEYLSGWQRTKADFINARNDEEKTRMEFAKYAVSTVLHELLSVADSLDMALRHSTALETSDNAKLPNDIRDEGIKQIARQLEELLKQHGVTPIQSIGMAFDPQKHEALEQIPITDETQDHHVLEELQKGYMIHDKVLRPSKVKVGIYH